MQSFSAGVYGFIDFNRLKKNKWINLNDEFSPTAEEFLLWSRYRGIFFYSYFNDCRPPVFVLFLRVAVTTMSAWRGLCGTCTRLRESGRCSLGWLPRCSEMLRSPASTSCSTARPRRRCLKVRARRTGIYGTTSFFNRWYNKSKVCHSTWMTVKNFGHWPSFPTS